MQSLRLLHGASKTRWSSCSKIVKRYGEDDFCWILCILERSSVEENTGKSLKQCFWESFQLMPCKRGFVITRYLTEFVLSQLHYVSIYALLTHVTRFLLGQIPIDKPILPDFGLWWLILGIKNSYVTTVVFSIISWIANDCSGSVHISCIS